MKISIRSTRLVWLSLCLLFNLHTHAQTFQKSFNGVDLTSTFGDILQTPDGGFLVIGQDFPVALDSIGALLYKLDSSLEIEWTRRYRFLHRTDFSGLTALSDGNYLLFGSTRQDFTLTCGGTLVKIDPSGNVIWSRYYDESCDDRTIFAFENSDNSFQLFIRLGVTGRATKLVKTNSVGEITDKFFYKYGDEEVKIEEVVRDAAGDFYMAGTVLDDTVQRQFIVIKYDGSSTQWANFYKVGRSSQSLVGLGFLPDGSLGMTGQVFVDSSTSNYNTFLMQIGTDGSLIEAFEIDYAPFEFGSWVQSLADGSYIIGGNYTINPTGKPTMTKFSATGELLWSRGYGKEGEFVLGGKIIELSDGRLLQLARRGGGHIVLADALGRTPCDAYTLSPEINSFPVTVSPVALTMETPPVVDLALPLTESSPTIMSEFICEDTVVISGFSENFDLLAVEHGKIYPNPAREFILVEGLPAGMPFSIVSISGQRVFSGVSSDNFTTVAVTDLPNGLYVIPELSATFILEK